MFALNATDYPLLILTLGSNDPVKLDQWFASSVTQAPDMLSRPWIIDLGSFPGHVDIGEMVRVCRKFGVTLAGVMGAGGGALSQASAMGLACLPNADHLAVLPVVQPAAEAPPSPAPVAPTADGARVVASPVRSGQQVWAQHQDLVLLGTVSAAAEVMADGNVHCYGTLRGRVAAGVSGNENARVFVRKLEAQVVSIAGVYMAEEELAALPQWGQSAMFSLVDHRLQVAALPDS
ncbi:septum site-determining protein MinC [Litorivicinus lipolyticus]|uniref:Probable septum site-determining protein MinC n=1 Tax=Litorivicinus lipolyticus TaxID=418701 RepID=A0A5Q2QBJ2_9GAMM|nr:septum site-determining protein MinC [Litorivicinus lipolyticus]QGG79642.1 septum site-determining protein MinC [Litorivicinus lipolyticus]